MKAKLVNENINFERGQDPKSSMDIGASRMIDEVVWSQNILPSIEEVVGFDMDFMGHKILVTKIKEPIANQYLPYRGVTDIPGIFVGQQPSEKAVYDMIKSQIIEYVKTNESVNFERGQDPKDSMSIGVNANVMKFLQWVRNDFQLDKDHVDYFGYINLGYTGGKDYIFKDPEMQDGYERFVKDYKRYLPTMKEMGLYLTNKPDIEETIIHDDSILDGHDHMVLESVNFQRGKDPREAMSVGLDAEMESKYGKYWKIFKRCNDLSHISPNFSWVSEIQHEKNYPPYFNIESEFYYTDQDDFKIPVQFVITLTQHYILCEDVVSKQEDTARSVKKFVEFTEAFEDTEDWVGVFESVNFERGQDPKRAMRIGHQADLKNQAAKIDWDWYPDPEELETEEILDLHDYKGFKIKIAKIEEPRHEAEDIYYAVSDTGEPYADEPTFYDNPEDALTYEKKWLDEYFIENN